MLSWLGHKKFCVMDLESIHREMRVEIEWSIDSSEGISGDIGLARIDPRGRGVEHCKEVA
jgi:hypothetical protein